MTQLKRSVLLAGTDDRLQILPADAACQRCPAPCRPVVAAPQQAVPADLSLSSGLLNRLALAFFGVPLLLIGSVIFVLDAQGAGLLTPMVLVSGVVLACAVGGKLAQRHLADVVRAQKNAGAA